MNYTVQNGDSPARIAQKLTGNPGLAWQLVAANPSLRGGLYVGQQLTIPSSWTQYGGGVPAYGYRPQAYGYRGASPQYGYAQQGGGGYAQQQGIGPEYGNPQPGGGGLTPNVQNEAFLGRTYMQGVAPCPPGMRRIATPNGLRCYPISPFFGVGDANSIALELQVINNQANTPPTADADGSYHGAVGAYQTAGAVAVAQGGLGPDLDATYSQYSGYNNSSTQAAWQANANLQAINSGDGTSATPASLTDAQNAQQTLQQMAAYYGTASNLGIQAAAAGGGTPPTSQFNTATIAAAQAIAQTSQSALCNLGGSSTGNATVNAFQVAYNTSTGVKPLATDGKYGPLTRAAAAVVLSYNGGGTAPSPCKSYTNTPGGGTVTCPAGQTLVNGQCVTTAPTGCPSGQVPDSVTGACVAACPAGQVPANGVCVSTSVVPPAASSTATASTGPLIAGVILVVLGAGAVTYAVEKKKHKGGRRATRKR
jgi:LysM domain